MTFGSHIIIYHFIFLPNTFVLRPESILSDCVLVWKNSSKVKNRIKNEPDCISLTFLIFHIQIKVLVSQHMPNLIIIME